MTIEIKKGKSIEELSNSITYRDENVNISFIRRMIGLDGSNEKIQLRWPLPEIVRQFELLKRVGGMQSGDLDKIRDSIPREDNPYEKRVCSKHGYWYHDAFGCMHHDHVDAHNNNSIYDKTCKDKNRPRTVRG